MKRRFLAGTALSIMFAASGAVVHAQPAGWYGAVDLGAGTDPAGDGQASPLLAQPDDWAGFAHVGYHLDPHWRVELQGGYRAGATSPALAPGGAGGASGFCAASTTGAGCGPRDRAIGAYAMVANLIFDLKPDNRWFDPFFAFGAGVSQPDPAAIAATNPAIQILQMNARDAQVAYQALVGFAFRPRDRLHVDLSYRWLGASGPSPVGEPTAFNGRYQDQTVAISLRYALSSPRAAIAPPRGLGFASSMDMLQVRSTAPHTLLVETPSNAADLAIQAQAVADRAALSASEGDDARIVVDGQADPGGRAAYDQRLSERRAKAMADAVVSLGVSPATVKVRWAGEAAAVATPAVEADLSAGR